MGHENVLHAIHRVKPMMHCFGYIHESNGIDIIDWKDRVAPKSPPRKNKAVHRHFEEDPNSYPQPFNWKKDQGNQTLAVNAAIMTGVIGLRMRLG